MCRLDLFSVLVHERIPSSLPLSRALRSQRYEEQARSRREERQAWANLITYIRAQENEHKEAMQMRLPQWMADTINGGAAANARVTPPAPTALSPSASTTANAVVGSAGYGAIRHRRPRQEHVALNAQPRRRTVQNQIAELAAAEADERANALTDSIIHALFNQPNNAAAAHTALDDEKSALNMSMHVNLSEEKMDGEHFVLVLVDDLDEKSTHFVEAAPMFGALQQQLSRAASQSVALSAPVTAAPVSVAFSAFDYVDESLLAHSHTVEVAD